MVSVTGHPGEVGEFVFQSKGIQLLLPNRFIVGSDRLTAGFVVGPGKRPCFLLHAPEGFDFGEELARFTIIVRGYLLEREPVRPTPPSRP